MTQTERIISKLVKAIAGDKDAARVTVTSPVERYLVIEISVSESDTGRLIGKGGATWRGLRSLALSIGAQERCRVEFRPIAEPPQGKSAVAKPVAARDEWPEAEMLALLRETCEAVLSCPDSLRIIGGSDAERTVTDVAVSRSEPHWSVETVGAALGVVAMAIGRAHGRTWHVTMRATEEPDPKQPATAAGRFAK